MKQHNKVKRLKKRQEGYDKFIAENTGAKASYRRPGSYKK
jgi:hypothetical protein